MFFKYIITFCALTIALYSKVAVCQTQSPARANVLHLASSAAFISMDPHSTSDIYSSMVQQLVYESLYEYEFDSSPLKLRPSLAAEMPVVSAGGLVYEIKILKGVNFHDDPCFAGTQGKGRELTAQDIVKSFERIARPNFASASFGQISKLVKGLNEFHAAQSPSISGVQSLGRYKIRIQLKKPFPRFIYWLAGIHSAILPVECEKHYGDAWPSHAVGTGPFQLENFTPFKVQVRRNTGFRKQFYRGEFLPSADKVEVNVLVQDLTRWLEFKAGHLDATTVPRDALGDIPALTKTKSVKHLSRVRSDVTYLIFNLDDPIYGKNLMLRQAICAAIDFDELLRVAYGDHNAAVRANSLIPPSLKGYVKVPAPCKHQDHDAVKKLFAKAGYPDGKELPEIRYVTQGDTVNRQIADALMRALKPYGIRFDPQFLTWPEMTTRLKQGAFTMTFYGWTSDFPDVDNHLQLLTSATLPPTGSNFGKFVNKEYDELVDKISQLEDGAPRQAKIKAALNILAKDLPIIPVAHRVGHRVFQPWLKNAAFTNDTVTGAWAKYFGIKKE